MFARACFCSSEILALLIEIANPIVKARLAPQLEKPAFTFGNAIDEWLAEYVPTRKAATQFTYFAGLRAAEIRGLRRQDIDFNRRTLTVRQAITRGPGKNGRASTLCVDFRIYKSWRHNIK